MNLYTAPQSTPRRLGIEAAAEMQAYFEQRSADMAAHFGLSPAAVRRQHEGNPVYWQHLERRWMSEAFGPLAPLRQAAQQEREDRQALRDARRAARREAWAKAAAPEVPIQEAPLQEAEALEEPPRPGLWQRGTLALTTFLSRLTGAALVVIAGYLVPVWLSHHGLLTNLRFH